MATGKDAVESRTLSDGTIVLENARGSARLSRVGQGVVLFVCEGVLSVDFYQPMVAVAQLEVERAGSLAMFVDGLLLRSVDTAFREAWTEWFKAHRHHFHMQLLVRSKLMDMAASLANLFTGISVIKSYSSVSAWERACVADAPGFRRIAKASA
jgi:hypothetical protein